MRSKELPVDELQYFHDNWKQKTKKEWQLYFGVSRVVIDKAAAKFGFNFAEVKRILPQSTRLMMSQKRRDWMRRNPDKHPWKRSDKFTSKPCEKAKEFLKSLGVDFVAEFAPNVADRNFSIDIAIPDKMIAIEINGNHHYETNGDLKQYYKERHDLLVSSGWTVFEVHYSACFDFTKWEEFVKRLLSIEKIAQFDYFNYSPKVKSHLSPCSCGNMKWKTSDKCKSCGFLGRRKAIRPTKDDLEALIQDHTLTNIGKMFGVSDNAVKNWCKSYGITTLGNSYRMAKYHASK